MRHPSDDVLDGALRIAAARLRDQQIARADTDEAWARFETQQADEVVVPVRASQVPGRCRGWVSVAAIGLAAASTLVLVWLQSRPAPENPVDLPSTTVPAATSTTQASAVDVPPALILPKLPWNKVIASLSAVSDSEWYAMSDVGPPRGPQSYPQLWQAHR